MADIVNLRRFKKRKARDAAAKVADENRASHGRTRAQKEAEKSATERRDRQLDGHLLDPSPDQDDPSSDQ